jgi:hypothetical protein
VLVEEIHPARTGNIFALLVSGDGIPLQVSLIQAKAFFAAGAFDPTIIGVEDRDVGRRLALLGDIAYTPYVVAKIRIGEQGSTTTWARLAEDDRWGREKALMAQNSSLECVHQHIRVIGMDGEPCLLRPQLELAQELANGSESGYCRVGFRGWRCGR